MISELWLVIVMTAIVSASPSWCMVLIRLGMCYDSQSVLTYRHRCRGYGLSVAAVSNILGLPGSSRRLPGWPKNSVAHLEAAPPESGLCDGWGYLCRMSS